MAIKPSPTIAGKLRKLFNNNKQTIEPAIGDSIPGGGSEPFVVTFSGTSEGGNAACDKTHAEIFEAWKAGKQIVVNYEGFKNYYNIPWYTLESKDETKYASQFGFTAFLFTIEYTNQLSEWRLMSGFDDRGLVYYVDIDVTNYTLTPV